MTLISRSLSQAISENLVIAITYDQQVKNSSELFHIDTIMVTWYPREDWLRHIYLNDDKMIELAGEDRLKFILIS